MILIIGILIKVLKFKWLKNVDKAFEIENLIIVKYDLFILNLLLTINVFKLEVGVKFNFKLIFLRAKRAKRAKLPRENS